MARKGKTKTKRNAQKYLNAYQIAERQLNGYDEDGDNSGDDGKDEIFMNEKVNIIHNIKNLKMVY